MSDLGNIEAALVTRILLDRDIRTTIRRKITADYFFDPSANLVFKYLLEYYANPSYGETPSMEVFSHEFPDFELVEIDDSAAALCDKLRERKLYSDIAATLQEVADVTRGSPLDGLETLLAHVSRLSVNHHIDESTTIASLADSLRNQYFHMKENPTGLIGLPYPWPALNKATLGAKGGQLIFWYARPKTGKTWHLLEMLRFWYKLGHRILLLSQELTPDEIAGRFAALVACVDYDTFLRGKLSKEDEDRLFEVLEAFESDPPFVIDRLANVGEAAITELAAKCDEHKPRIVAVDGVYFLGNDWKELTLVTRGLKNIARTKDVIMLGTTQSNRASDKNGEGADARDVAFGDAFFQDCDLLVKMIRTEQHRREGQCLCIIKGIRQGVALSWLSHFKVADNFAQIREFSAEGSDADETLGNESENDYDAGPTDAGWTEGDAPKPQPHEAG
jgi:replicative DNA helicase